MEQRGFLTGTAVLATALVAGCGTPDDGGDGYDIDQSDADPPERTQP